MRRLGEMLFKPRKMQIPLIFSILFIYQGVQGEDIDCQNLKQVTEGAQPLNISLQSVPQPRPPVTLWYKPEDPNAGGGKLELKFGTNTWLVEYNRKAMKLTLNLSNKKMKETRIWYEWFVPQMWTRVTLSNSQDHYRTDIGDQMLDVHLGQIEIDSIDFVQINGSKVTLSMDCVNIKENKGTSMQTTTAATTTPFSTTFTTTALPTTEPDTTIVPEDYEATSEDYIDDDNSTFNRILDVTPLESKGNLDGYECSSLPIWVWICVGIMITFVLISLILFICVIVLCRKNKSLLASGGGFKQGNILATPPSGYGHQSKDLHFIRPGNKESVVGIAPQPSFESYTQTLNLPSGNQLAPNVKFSTGPRNSDYRRSTSCPERTPSLTFPAPPATPPPERNETVPLFCPNGSVEENRQSSGKGRHSIKGSSMRRKKHVKECFDADDESSSGN